MILTFSAPSSAQPQEVSTVMAVSQGRAPSSGEGGIKEAGWVGCPTLSRGVQLKKVLWEPAGRSFLNDKAGSSFR